mmetsp:Transcript_11330/g.22083  ORF Transcript_11330/g.22083 Transcript_11330/m.22083 type:complete len:275 (-) Transcript_11330:25-849(-)
MHASIIKKVHYFLERRHASCLKLGVDDLVTDRNFESTGCRQVLRHTAEHKEEHECLNLILPHKSDNLWGLDPEHAKELVSKHHERNGSHLHHTCTLQKVGNDPRGLIIAAKDISLEVGVFLLQEALQSHKVAAVVSTGTKLHKNLHRVLAPKGSLFGCQRRGNVLAVCKGRISFPAIEFVFVLTVARDIDDFMSFVHGLCSGNYQTSVVEAVAGAYAAKQRHRRQRGRSSRAPPHRSSTSLRSETSSRSAAEASSARRIAQKERILPSRMCNRM